MIVAKRPLLPGRRWAGEAGSEEERRHLKHRKMFEKRAYQNISARIPLQSKIGCEEPIFASFPPGEAVGATAPVRQIQVVEFHAPSGSWRPVEK